MKITDTISVNPSKKAMGHVESSESIFRANILGSQTESQSIDLVKVLFPAAKSGLFEYRKYETPMRTLFATILIVTGISLLTTSLVSYSAAFAICTLCFGGFLAIGLFTRPVMLGASVYYCICGALALRSGMADMTSFSLMFGSLIFGLIGAGKYSCDTILRSAIIRHRRLSERKMKENFMGYKAFHSVKF